MQQTVLIEQRIKTIWIIPIDTEQAFNKTQHFFHDFFLKVNKLGIEEKYLNLLKGIYEKHTAGIIFNGERLNVLPLT